MPKRYLQQKVQLVRLITDTVSKEPRTKKRRYAQLISILVMTVIVTATMKVPVIASDSETEADKELTNNKTNKRTTRRVNNRASVNKRKV